MNVQWKLHENAVYEVHALSQMNNLIKFSAYF